mmetsp:Transcript_31782/g.52387  ORF Transcript_31782/g.52387 Transcript_31782/m.52387 type:complete len:476 (-) Transcript_31782:276-1703(-)
MKRSLLVVLLVLVIATASILMQLALVLPGTKQKDTSGGNPRADASFSTPEEPRDETQNTTCTSNIRSSSAPNATDYILEAPDIPPSPPDKLLFDIEHLPRLWLHVDLYGEGMANSRKSIAEMLAVAKKFNMTFVEPCILEGRLKSCGDKRFQKAPKILMRELYRIDEIRAFYPHVVSHEFYEQHVLGPNKEQQSTTITREEQANTTNVTAMVTTTTPSITTFLFCLWSGTPSTACDIGDMSFQSFFGAKDISPVNDALDMARSQPNRHVIINIHVYRKFSLKEAITRGGAKLLEEPLYGQALRHLQFRQEHFDFVDRALCAMGIHGPYDVIHWRAELKVMDHVACARAIMASKRALNSTTTLLISSISIYNEFQWRGYTNPKDRQDATDALQMLFDDGFHKLDHYWRGNETHGTAFRAAWDLIFAIKAGRFAACSRKCRRRTCSRCNHFGAFQDYSLDLRSYAGKSSDQCWPTEG